MTLLSRRHCLIETTMSTVIVHSQSEAAPVLPARTGPARAGQSGGGGIITRCRTGVRCHIAVITSALRSHSWRHDCAVWGQLHPLRGGTKDRPHYDNRTEPTSRAGALFRLTVFQELVPSTNNVYLGDRCVLPSDVYIELIYQ